MAIGNATIRERIQKEIETVTLIHPDAVIGDGCIINTAASVDHDCFVDDYSHIAVGAHLCGIVHIIRNTWIGAGVTVSNNIIVCNNCMVGTGAVVISNIDVPGTYVGVPARRTNGGKMNE